MSWLFSQALVAEYLEASSLDGEPCAQLNVMPTPHKFWRNDKTMEFSRLSQFGLTLQLLTESRGAELLTWYLADFHAKTFQLPEKVPDWTAQGQGFGEKWHGLLAKYDPNTHSLKTAQLSLLEDSTGCCPTLPRWGLMLDGELYPQPMLEPRTAESESGYWPTPQTRFGTNDGDLAQLAKKCDNQEEFNQMAYRASAKKKATYWLTPTKTSPMDCEAERRRNLPGLESRVKMWPTATATAYKGWSPNHNRAETDDRLDYTVERENYQTGQQTPPMRLNPAWVEWLMGWPIGWTELRPLAMDKFHEWQQQHSVFLLEK